MVYINQESVEQSLLNAAQQMHDYYLKEGQDYSINDLLQVLTLWLEGTIETLADDAFSHCISCDPNYACNRVAFETFLSQMKRRTHQPISQDEAA